MMHRNGLQNRSDAVIKTRIDGAFFGENIVQFLDVYRVDYTISVPFER